MWYLRLEITQGSQGLAVLKAKDRILTDRAFKREQRGACSEGWRGTAREEGSTVVELWRSITSPPGHILQSGQNKGKAERAH